MDIDKRIIVIEEYIADNKCTVRSAASIFGISKSTVHKDMTTKLKDYNIELYESVRKILDYNKKIRHIRGGEATKNKYIRAKEERFS